MQLESWDDAVRKAKGKAEEGSFDVVQGDGRAPPEPRPVRRPIRWMGAAIALGILAVFALGVLASRFFAVPPKVVPPVAGASAAAPSRSLPASYRVIKADGDMAKDVVYIRLASKFEMPELREIAHQVRGKWTTGKERMVFWFFLPEIDTRPPGRPFGVQPWAFGDFDGPIHGPGLTIEMHGFTAAEEAELLAGALPPSDATVLGRWLDDSNGRALYTIYSREGGFFLRTHHGPGSGSDEELIEEGTPQNRRYRRRAYPSSSEYYVINGRGDFEIHDGYGPGPFARRVDR